MSAQPALLDSERANRSGKRVAVVGCGYVGLVTAACLAAAGHHVVCVDVSEDRLARIREGEAPFHEPGLAECLRLGLEAGRLTAIADLERAVATSDVTIIAVATPFRGGAIDLTDVECAARDIGRAIRSIDHYHVVVVKSTVIPGTTDTVVRDALERASGLPVGRFGLCMNPEFLREGTAVTDFMTSDRIVIGEWDPRSGDAVDALYDWIDCPRIRTTLRNAELIKYASNALLANLISFSNEIASLCERVPGSDVQTVLAALHLDKRLSGGAPGPAPILEYLKAGAGFGGSCLPKDVNALRVFARNLGGRTPLLDAVMSINDERGRRLVDMVEEELGDLRGRPIAVLGLTFKPGTDDVRDSPALRIVDELRRRGATVRAYDPVACDNAKLVLDPDVMVTNDAAAALDGAEAVVVATAWPELRDWNWTELCRVMSRPVIVDGRNLLADVRWPHGVEYRQIGVSRPKASVERGAR